MDSSRREFFRLFGFASFSLIIASCRDTVLSPPTEIVTTEPQPGVAPTGSPSANNPNANANGNNGNNSSNPNQNAQTGNSVTPTQTPNHSGSGNNSNPNPNPTATPAPQATPTPGNNPAPGGATVTMQDIRMEGWSTLGGGFLGYNGNLSTNLIKANQTVTLNYVQDPHGHKFTLTPAHFLQLRQGKTVDVISTEAQGHKHMIRINPASVVAGSAKVTMPINM